MGKFSRKMKEKYKETNGFLYVKNREKYKFAKNFIPTKY